MDGNQNQSKKEILKSLETIQSEYDKVYKKLKSSRSIESRLIYGAMLKDVENSLSHIKRQIFWVRYEKECEE